MATRDPDQLTRKQIVRLAAAISADNMAAIAEGYMDIDDVTIKNSQYENKGQAQAFNRDILKYWMCKNPHNQVQRLSQILYKAAEDHGYVDPKKAEQILDKSREDARLPQIPKAGAGASHSRKAAEDCSYMDLQQVQQKLETLRVAAAVPTRPEVTYSDLIQLVEDLRPHMAQTMKMEPAPWIRDYVVDMEQLYTELTLEKIDKKLFRQKRRKLENYKVLFALHKPGMLEFLAIRYYFPKLSPKRKILFKGNPGMGKTSLVKKIAYDWAKGDFDKVSIVFFVYLKSVNSDDLIEDAIMWQNPMLEGLHVTAAKLANILERFGPECLLILDGLDECAHGQNTQVHKIITGAKFLNCNVILTSRPHSTREFERYFDAIVSVEGFTRTEARKFAHCIVDDTRKINQVLNFNPAGERADRPVHNVPILLSFLCLLVTEDNIDLSDRKISMGEIYFRMVQCLHKKFTIRKGIKFKISSLVTVLMSLGKLALETLLSGNPLLERSKIIEEVGKDVFDYGLLIGQDGFSLTRDLDVDVLVSFPHRSLQEFLGAFYFVLSLGREETVNELDKAVEEYLKNPLFSQFCLWILDESNTFLPFPERSVACDRLNRYIAEKIDDLTIHFSRLVSKFPALGLALNDHDHLALGMLIKILKGCFRVKDLVFHSRHPVELILMSLSDNMFESLKSIKIHSGHERGDAGELNRGKDKLIPVESPLPFLDYSTDDNFKLVVDSESFVSMINICAKRKKSGKTLVLIDCGMILDTVARVNAEGKLPNLRVLDIKCRLVGWRLHMLLTGTFPSLTTLVLSDCNLRGQDLESLAAANVEGKLPNLCVLDISRTSVDGRLYKLLTGTFLFLTTLILSECHLTEQDLTCLTGVNAQGQLPELKYLDISWNQLLALDRLFCAAFPILTTLIARGCSLDVSDLPSLSEASGANDLQHLVALDLSQNPHIARISDLHGQALSSLNILILRDCLLNSEDMLSLAHASAENRLPQLKLLDLSLNHIGYRSKSTIKGFTKRPKPKCLSYLLSKQFPSLTYFILCKCKLNEKDLDSLAQAKLTGKLPAVKYIDVSFNKLTDHLGHLTRDSGTGREVSWDKIVCFEELLDGSKKP